MANKKNELTSQEKQKKLSLQKRFGGRITVARQGREAFLAKDYIVAIKKYNEYLSILSESKECPDIYSLTPAMFDKETQITELLLISHIYWETARMNEMTPKLQQNFQKALNQFVKFTINQPYQILNSEMLRKYIKKNKNSSRQIGMLNQAYSQIFVQSKKCFIATLCYGEEHQVTQTLRMFKLHLIDWPFGQGLIRLYYNSSSSLVDSLENYHFLRLLIISLCKPILSIFSKFTETSIFKRCSYFLKLLPKNGSKH